MSTRQPAIAGGAGINKAIVGQARGELQYYPIYSQLHSTGKFVLTFKTITKN
jgi:hypothetical protein